MEIVGQHQNWLPTFWMSVVLNKHDIRCCIEKEGTNTPHYKILYTFYIDLKVCNLTKKYMSVKQLFKLSHNKDFNNIYMIYFWWLIYGKLMN